MTRIVIWLMGTVAGVTLLLGYPTSTSGPATASTATATAPVTPGSAGSPSTGSSSTGSSGTGPPGAGPTGTGAGSSAAARTVTGAVAQTRWGPVQVAITVADGRITDVEVPEYPTGNGRDREINADALPVLQQETLSARSADIDMVSGATVTSQGYLTSLQSALDQAGL